MRELRFADFRIDLEQLRLYRGDVRIPIGRKTLDALLFLIENKSRLVTRESLHRYIWASERISPSTIPMCITEIRRALGDDARSPRFVSSTKGRGYRFVGEVVLHADAEPRSHQHIEFPFVGRESAITALQETVRQTRADLQGRTISILGEAGIGKSRLLAEFLAHSAQTFDFIVARTNPSTPNVAYSIWAHALRIALAKYPDNENLARNATQIGSILPEIRAESERSKPTARFDQSIFFLHWSTAFRSLARQRPLVVALEDFHHADEDSVALLEHMCRELASSPILFIIVARPSLATRRYDRFRESSLHFVHQAPIHLAPFTLNEVASFIDPFEKERESLAQEIHRQTAGNAFYVTHLLRMRRKQSSHPAPTSKVPAGNASEIVAKQLDDLPESTRSALLMASVVGHSFTPSIVASALAISVPTLLEDLEPAHAACVIQQDGSDLSFCHSILRDSLYCSLTPRNRMEHHEQIVKSLRQLAPTSTTSATTLFHHLSQAYPLVSAAEIHTEALTAGLEAIARLAFHDALRIFDAALEVLAGESTADPEPHLEILINRASAMYYIGDRDHARESLLEAANWSRRLNAPQLLARCGLAMAPDFLSIEVGAYDADQEMLLREAYRGLPLTNVALRAKVLSRLSQINQWTWAQSDEPTELAMKAYQLATESGDLDAIVSALAAQADAAHGPDRADARLQYILGLQQATLAQSDTYSFLLQQMRLISTLLEIGEIRRLNAENDRHRRVADKIGLPQYRWYPTAIDSMLMCLAGRLDEADRLADQYKQIAGVNPDQNVIQTSACQAVLRGIEMDQSENFLAITEAFAREKKTVLSWGAAVAWMQWDCGQHNAARETLRQFSERDINKMFREPGGTIGLAALAEACAYLGDRRQAQFLYDLISPARYTFASAGYGVVYFGSMARYAGVLAISLQHYREAEKLLTLAQEQERKTGARTWLCYANLDLQRAKHRSLSLGTSVARKTVHENRSLLTPLLARALRLTNTDVG